MKTANWYKKTAFAALLSSSFLIFGSSIYQSIKVTDTSYMKDSEIKFSLRLDEDREVASAERELKNNNVSIQYIPVNSLNRAIINGDWIITRIEDEKENVIYSEDNSDEVIKVEMTLEETSFVKLNNDEEYKFDISYLHESNNRIALFRSFGKGFEIIEARRVKGNENSIESIQPAKLVGLKKNNELNFSEASNKPLVLERAMVNKKLSIGRDVVSGSITVNGEIEENGSFTMKSFDSMTVYIEEEGKDAFEFSIDQADLTGPGTFEVEIDGEQISGIVTNNGKDAYRVRIAAGPKALQGALFNFVTDEEYDRIEEELREASIMNEEKRREEEYAREAKKTEVQAIQLEAQNSRKNVIDASFGSDERELNDEELEENYDEEPIEGEENMREVASVTGFAF